MQKDREQERGRCGRVETAETGICRQMCCKKTERGRERKVERGQVRNK